MESFQNRFWSTEKRRDTIRLVGIATFNGLLTLITGAQFLSKGSGPLLVEASHDIGDTFVTSARAVALQKDTQEKPWLKKFRKATYACVSTLAIAATAKSGFELYQATSEILENGFTWNEVSDNLDRIINGAIIASGNEASYVVSQTLEGENEIIHDAKHHAKVDRDTSLLLAAGIAIGAVVPLVAEATGIATGTYTAWHMRPTESNMHHHNH